MAPIPSVCYDPRGDCQKPRTTANRHYISQIAVVWSPKTPPVRFAKSRGLCRRGTSHRYRGAAVAPSRRGAGKWPPKKAAQSTAAERWRRRAAGLPRVSLATPAGPPANRPKRSPLAARSFSRATPERIHAVYAQAVLPLVATQGCRLGPAGPRTAELPTPGAQDRSLDVGTARPPRGLPAVRFDARRSDKRRHRRGVHR